MIKMFLTTLFKEIIQFLNIFPDESGWDTEPIKDEI